MFVCMAYLAGRATEKLIENQIHAISTVKVLFVRNSCPNDRQLIKTTIVRSLNDSDNP